MSNILTADAAKKISQDRNMHYHHLLKDIYDNIKNEALEGSLQYNHYFGTNEVEFLERIKKELEDFGYTVTIPYSQDYDTNEYADLDPTPDTLIIKWS